MLLLLALASNPFAAAPVADTTSASPGASPASAAAISSATPAQSCPGALLAALFATSAIIWTKASPFFT